MIQRPVTWSAWSRIGVEVKVQEHPATGPGDPHPLVSLGAGLDDLALNLDQPGGLEREQVPVGPADHFIGSGRTLVVRPDEAKAAIHGGQRHRSVLERQAEALLALRELLCLHQQLLVAGGQLLIERLLLGEKFLPLQLGGPFGRDVADRAERIPLAVDVHRVDVDKDGLAVAGLRMEKQFAVL